MSEQIRWNDPIDYGIDLDLVMVLCVVEPPDIANAEFPRACEFPLSSGDHAVGDEFVSIGHANEDGEWFVAGWDMTQDCWTDAQCFEVVGWRYLPEGNQ